MTTPRLSVVMATYNRAETLAETLRCLAAQTLPPDQFEVIVIDDGSPDKTADVVADAQRTARFPLTYLSHPNRGPGYTQNRGLREARAPIAMLMADDIFLAPQALAEHLAAHGRNPQREVAVLGRVLQSPQLDQSVFLRTWDPFRFRDLKDRAELPYYFFWACNISFKRDFMLAHGMFGEAMGRAGAAAHEDVELGYRLSLHGLRIVYSHEALGHHYHIETLDGAMKRAYQRGLNFGEFHAKVPQPEIVVRYHVLATDTLADHWRAVTGPRRCHLIGPDRSLALLALRYALRIALFNTLTVKGIWLPFLRAAESLPPLATLVNRNFYRGVISYHFFRGCADARRIYGDPRPGLGRAT